MSLALLFHFLCAQHVPDINVSIIKSLRLFLLNYHIGRIVLCFSLQHRHYSNPTTLKLQHTSNQEQYDQCGNSTEKVASS